MSEVDISLHRHRDRMTMMALSQQGTKWMQQNLTLDGPLFSFDANLLEEMLAELEKAGLIVETH